MKEIELIICTEQGYLESMSKLLIYSLRTFGGQFSNIPIYSYQPRKKYSISRETILFFEKYEVEHIDLDLNTKFVNYPLANKPLACSHREMNSHSDYLFFLDSDIFFLREPSEVTDFNDSDVILRPVGLKNIGTQHPDDSNAPYWQNLYSLLGVKIQRYVTSIIDNCTVLEYYNSGQIITKTRNYLFNSWKENFIKVMDFRLKPNDGLLFVEQSVLAATISQLELNVKQIDKHYNVPVHALLDQSKRDDYDMKRIVNVHYHKIFINEDGLNPIEKFLNRHMNGNLINDKIKEFGLIKKSKD